MQINPTTQENPFQISRLKKNRRMYILSFYQEQFQMGYEEKLLSLMRLPKTLDADMFINKQ